MLAIFSISILSVTVYSGTWTLLEPALSQGTLIFQVSLHVNGYFGTITKCPDYMEVSLSILISLEQVSLCQH